MTQFLRLERAAGGLADPVGSTGTGSAALLSLRSLVVVLLVLVFWKASGVRYWPHVYAGEIPNPTKPIYYLEFLICLSAIGAALLAPQPLLAAARRQHWLVPLFVLWAVAAGLLVKLPLITAFLNMSGYLDTWLVLVLATSILGVEKSMGLLARTAFVFVVANLASAAVPSVSMMVGDFAGRFRGLTAHRNDLAYLACICALLAVAARGLAPRWLRLMTIVGSIALIAGARSIQGILLLPMGLLCYYFAGQLRMFRHPIVGVSFVLLASLGIAVWEQFGSLESLLGYFGRDASFSGRDRIWALSWHLMQYMPWEGYGPGQIGSGVISEALLIRFGLGTLFGTAHNAYLEAFLTYGWVGGSLFIGAVLSGLVFVLRRVTSRADPVASLAFALLFIAVLGGLTASEKLFVPGLGWFTFVLTLVLAQHRGLVRP